MSDGAFEKLEAKSFKSGVELSSHYLHGISLTTIKKSDLILPPRRDLRIIDFSPSSVTSNLEWTSGPSPRASPDRAVIHTLNCHWNLRTTYTSQQKPVDSVPGPPWVAVVEMFNYISSVLKGINFALFTKTSERAVGGRRFHGNTYLYSVTLVWLCFSNATSSPPSLASLMSPRDPRASKNLFSSRWSLPSSKDKDYALELKNRSVGYSWKENVTSLRPIVRLFWYTFLCWVRKGQCLSFHTNCSITYQQNTWKDLAFN